MDYSAQLNDIVQKLTELATVADSLGSAVGYLSGLIVALIVAVTWKG